MRRKARAVWIGGLRDGGGLLSTTNGALHNAEYSFSTRFEQDFGTNPEEMIGAAHASCFAMTLSALLGEAGLAPERIATTATVRLENADAGFTITEIHLDVSAKVAGASAQVFEATALTAKDSCPISRLINAKITLDARLEG